MTVFFVKFVFFFKVIFLLLLIFDEHVEHEKLFTKNTHEHYFIPKIFRVIFYDLRNCQNFNFLGIDDSKKKDFFPK